MTEAFESLDLHDASIETIVFDWKAGRCDIILQSWSVEHRKSLVTFLSFFEVSHLEIPRDVPWGESVSINEVKECDGLFQIEMQSGDTISVVAKGFSYSLQR